MLRPMLRIPSHGKRAALRLSAWLLMALAVPAVLAAPLGAADDVNAVAGGATAAEVATLSAGDAVLGTPPAPSENALVARVRDKASGMVETAMNFLGVRYRRGGQSAEQGFDCSGLTRKVFETSLGLALPRRADDQARAAGLVAIEREELRPGDLVFFNTLRRTFSHVGIYIGDGKFIHAPRTGAKVRIEDLGFSYWAKRFTGARRVDDAGEAPSPELAATGSVSTLAALPSPR
jgi:cell wall-associated NlpC family hydrolase